MQEKLENELFTDPDNRDRFDGMQPTYRLIEGTPVREAPPRTYLDGMLERLREQAEIPINVDELREQAEEPKE